MKRERGSALVQVLVMSVLLIILATGVMRVMFMNHVVVARVQTGDKMRDVAEQCRAKADAEWAASGTPCVTAVSCSDALHTVSITCPGPVGTVKIQVTRN